MLGVSRQGDVLVIEIQRPERRNALNAEVIDALREAVEGAADGGARVVVITGQGTVFCSGLDLSGAALAPNLVEEMFDKAIALNRAIDHAPVPVIAAINGPVIGAGIPLAIICDLRVVVPDAYFQFPVAKYGLVADTWTIRRLTSLVGHGRARAMMIAAEMLPAEDALATGMANRIGDLDAALAWAHELAGMAPLSMQHAKRVLNDDGAWDTELPIHKEMFDRARSSQDAIEAQVARFQKRPPVFTGR